MTMKRNKLILAMAFALASGALLAGCSSGGGEPGGSVDLNDGGNDATTTAPSDAGGDAAQSDGSPVVEIVMQDGGVIVLELDADAAPISVENFLKLVDQGFYDGLTFHRISQGFMIQGGCPDGTGTGGPSERIFGEFAANGYDNPLSFTRGTIGMARSGDPNSAGSQFFITDVDCFFLDGDYAPFGKVISGIEVVDAIASVPVNGDRAIDPPVMETIRRQ